jgi:adenylate cyclase
MRLAGGAAAGLLLAAAALALPDAADRAREAATDALMAVAPRPAPAGGEAPPVVAVQVGEADLEALGAWPWPRSRWAALVARLAEAGAAAIALDVAFVEAAEGDAALSAALAGAPAVLGLLAGRGPAPASGFGVALLGAPDLGGLVVLPGVAPSAVAGAPAAAIVLPGEVVRSVPLLLRVAGDDAPMPGLALGALARAVGAETLLVRADGESRAPAVQLHGSLLPVPEGGRLRLHPAPGRPVAALGAARVLAAEPGAAEAVRGRIVLLGATAPEAAPLRPSVFGPFTPSLRLQAEAVAQLAEGWVPRRPPGGAWAEALAAVALATLAALAVRRWPRGLGLGLALGLALAWPTGVAAALRLGPVLVDPALPAVGALLGGGAEAAAAALRLARERARLMDRFAHRLPPGVAAALLALPEAERLRPERRRVAVVLTDLTGFSAMVRAADPAAVVPLLNAYLAGVEAVVTAQGGTLERLIGDSVLAVFGAPLPQPDHGARALAAARALDRFAETFRARPDAAAIGWAETRIGVAAGEVLVGEVGGSRLTWTVCGDAANVAARLQELARTLGRRGLVAGIEDPSLAPPLGRFALRGLPGEAEVRPL